jgi:hypothetical protein
MKHRDTGLVAADMSVAGMYLLRRDARAGLVYNAMSNRQRRSDCLEPKWQSFLPTILEPPGDRWASPQVNDT